MWYIYIKSLDDDDGCIRYIWDKKKIQINEWSRVNNRFLGRSVGAIRWQAVHIIVRKEKSKYTIRVQWLYISVVTYVYYNILCWSEHVLIKNLLPRFLFSFFTLRFYFFPLFLFFSSVLPLPPLTLAKNK